MFLLQLPFQLCNENSQYSTDSINYVCNARVIADMVIFLSFFLYLLFQFTSYAQKISQKRIKTMLLRCCYLDRKSLSIRCYILRYLFIYLLFFFFGCFRFVFRSRTLQKHCILSFNFYCKCTKHSHTLINRTIERGFDFEIKKKYFP